jgi:hypothetical protein
MDGLFLGQPGFAALCYRSDLEIPRILPEVTHNRWRD